MKKNASDKSFVAHAYEVCPICGDKQGMVLIHKRLGDISKVHNETIGTYDPLECEHCGPKIKEGYVAIIICDLSKTTDENNPYRTGDVAFVKEDAVRGMVINPALAEEMIAKHAMFMGIDTAEHIGLMENGKFVTHSMPDA